jgi:hypothetical protein
MKEIEQVYRQVNWQVQDQVNEQVYRQVNWQVKENLTT